MWEFQRERKKRQREFLQKEWSKLPKLDRLKYKHPRTSISPSTKNTKIFTLRHIIHIIIKPQKVKGTKKEGILKVAREKSFVTHKASSLR